MTRTVALTVAFAAGALALAWPHAALACAVCAGSDESRQAFLGTTVFLSLTPLGLIGSGVGFVAWRVMRHDPWADDER